MLKTIKKPLFSRGLCTALDCIKQRIGGREGIRTLDPRIANAVLSQLSYSPVPGRQAGII
jgi:hypothetical protein